MGPEVGFPREQGRGERLKETPETFSGLFWNGEEAVRLGLADHFGNLDHVAKKKLGTVFGGKNEIGITIEELMKREAKM